MGGGRPKLKLGFKESRGITRCIGCVIATSESFWITGKLLKVVVIVNVHSIGLGMCMKLVIPLLNAQGVMHFGCGFGALRDECLLLFVILFGEIVDIAGLID